MDLSASILDSVTELIKSTHQSEKHLLEKVSKQLGKPLVLTNNHHQLLASASPGSVATIQSILAIQQVAAHAQPDFSLYQFATDAGDFWGWGTLVAYDEQPLGQLYLLDSAPSDPSEQVQALLTLASSLVADKLQKKLELRREKMKFKEPFLFDLLYGNIKQRSEILDYAKLWDWDFNSEQAVLVFALKDFNHLATDEQHMNKLLYIIEKTLLERNWQPITMKRGKMVSIILTKEDERTCLRDSANSIAKFVLREMARLEPETAFSCGIGKTYRDPRELFRSFQEAKLALDLGELLDIPVPYFEELGLERILYKHDAQDLKEFCETVIGKLVQYDQTNNTEFMETLDTFTANQFDMATTAQAMFLHKNTLRYRIKKIEEILEYKLDDLNNRLNIAAAFKIRKMRKI